jgi:hypothetical protein
MNICHKIRFHKMGSEWTTEKREKKICSRFYQIRFYVHFTFKLCSPPHITIKREKKKPVEYFY